MLNIENGQIILEMFVIQHTSIWPNCFLIVLRIQKTQALSVNLCDVTDNLWWCHRFWNLWISLKNKNLDNLRTKHFFLQIKKIINYRSRATLWQKIVFSVEVTFNDSSNAGWKKVTTWMIFIFLKAPSFILKIFNYWCFYHSIYLNKNLRSILYIRNRIKVSNPL